MSTIDTQKSRVDIVIHPSSYKRAFGYYINDDGLVRNTTGKQNYYMFGFSFTNSSRLQLKINPFSKANIDGNATINENDKLGGINIVRGDAFSFKTMYKVQINVLVEENGRKVEKVVDAKNIAHFSHTLTWTATQEEHFLLHEVSSIIFNENK